MFQHPHKMVVGDTTFCEIDLFFILLLEIMWKERSKVGWTRSKDDLVAVDGLAFNHQSNVRKVFLIQQSQEVTRDVCLHVVH